MRYTDQLLNSAAMDQKFFEGIPQKLIIISPPRTGSSMLCRLMLKANIGIPHEYFNEFHVRCLIRRFGLPEIGSVSNVQADVMQTYLSRLFAVRSRGGVFATKLQHKQYRLFVQKKIEERLFAGAKLVYLTRKDVVAQAVSWHFAELTGRWSFEARPMMRAKSEDNFFDIEKIMWYLDEILAEQVLWEYLFQCRRLLPLRVTYEDLQINATRVLLDIAEHTGITLERQETLYDDEGPYEGDPDLPSKREVIDYVRRVWSGGRGSRLDLANAPLC